MKPPSRTGIGVCAAATVAALLSAAGCSSPLHDHNDSDLRRSVRQSAERELVDARRYVEPRDLTRQDRVSRIGIAPEIMAELEKTAGPSSYPPLPDLGPDTFGTPQSTSAVSLEQAVQTAVERNLNVEFARLAPAISQAQVVAADAAFDWVFFANGQWAENDSPRASSSIGGSASGVAGDQSQNVMGTAGVRKPLISGGQFTTQIEQTYVDNETDNLTLDPDPSHATNLVIQLDQPLLRNFGSDVALAQVRLAKNTERDEIQNLKSQLISTVSDVERAYWDLVRAMYDVHITQRLLARGEDVLSVITQRRLDVRQSDIADATSQVESRRADVLTAQKVLRDASERLKVLMNDPNLTVGSEVLLIPADTAVDQPIRFSLVDCLNTAFANRPEIQRAIISLDNTSIRLLVADNARLPLLNLRGLTRISALEGNFGSAYGELTDAQYVDYQIRLDFEQPVGNRAAEAQYRVRQLERMQASIAFRNTMQGVVAEVKAALRNVELNYVLIEQRRAARIAAAETLRTLLVEEQTFRALDPAFLDLKLRRQQALAVAEQQEVSALTDYNAAMAQLYAAMGVALERNQIQFDVPAYLPDPRVNSIFPDADAVRPEKFERDVPGVRQ